LCSAQEAVQQATGLVPSLPQTKAASDPSDAAHMPPASTSQGVGDTSAMQNDVLKAVTQLLQQSQQVGVQSRFWYRISGTVSPTHTYRTAVTHPTEN